MAKTAILVDGGFYRKRAAHLWGKKTAEERAKELNAYCMAHLHDKDGNEERQLYRIFYYDCEPVGRRSVYHPLTKKNVDLDKSDTYTWTQTFLEELRKRRKFSDVPVIVVSAKSLTFNKVELLRLGADDYLTKPFDLDELLARIERNLLRSQKDTPNLCLTFGELSINTSSKIVTVADEIIVLTAKEYQLVELLAKYPDKVFSKQNLYESIWQEPFARDNDVINTHISNLRKKLKGEGCRIKTIWGLGYRFAK